MRKESRRPRGALCLLLLATAAGRGFAEGGVGALPEGELPEAMRSALPAEAPASVFSAKLGKGPEDDAELFVSGSWSATVLASLALQGGAGQGLRLSSAQPLLFSQAPDLSLSFLFYKKVFVEARVADDIAQAKYSMGYRGGKDELLREARVGNDGISFPSLPYLSFGEGSYRSFGAAATIASEFFEGRAMIRYDQADRVVKRFVGSTEVIDTVISPNAFIVGKYFLTRNLPAKNIVVFVQSVSGALSGTVGGKAYSFRKLEAGEYAYSSITGAVSLSSAATTIVLAHGDATDSTDGASIGGLDCDLLYEPPLDPAKSDGTLEPRLQALGRYATTASASTAEAFVRNVSSGLRDEAFKARIDPSGYVDVTRSDAEDPLDPLKRDDYRRPFASSAFADMPWLYTTDFASEKKPDAAPVYTRSLVVRSFSTSELISIDRDVVAGSVEVTRDGLPDYSFTVDSEKGILTLVPVPSATEEIVVSYMKQSAERKSGNLAGALGGFWDLGEDWKAWAALGASWALPGSSFSDDTRTNPGSVNLTAGERDSAGTFTHDAAIAARYSRDDATGLYRIEGMESASGYASTFGRDSATEVFAIAETAEQGLASAFPKIVGKLHADGSPQQALRITAPAAAAAPLPTAWVFKVEGQPPYSSFKAFSFFARIPSDAGLTVRLDDGALAPASSVEVVLPAGAGDGEWRRYSLHYGQGDRQVYVQAEEGGGEIAIAGSSSVSPSPSSRGSRLVIEVSGLSAGESAWVDEILLEESVGRAALLFQGKAAYSDPELGLSIGKAPIISGLIARADAQAALADTPYVSGGAELESTLFFARLGLRARASASSGSSLAFSGGHSLELPASDFPLRAKDVFDVDPSTGAFGRTDSIIARAGAIAGLTLAQSSAWTPSSSLLERGMLVQSWDGSLALGPALATVGLAAKNRSRPASFPEPSADYGSAWVGAFAYALPAFQSDSESREAKATLSVKGGAKEFLSASLGEGAEPDAAGGGVRRDTAELRVALPFEAARIGIEPYYSRSWKDKRNGATRGIAQDAVAALGDFSKLPALYASIPFYELASAGTAGDFASQSAPSGAALPEASLEPEAGLGLSREYGSRWYDFALPSAMAFSYRRILARTADQVTDSGLWSASMKFASINLFGSMGAYPLGLPFESDEYLSTLQAKYRAPRGGGGASLDLQYHSLSSLYARESDRLDAETRGALAKVPEKLDWSLSAGLTLSRRAARHWLLDLYSLAALRAPPPGGAEAAGAKASIASLYLTDLAGRAANARTTIGLKAGLAGLGGDASARSLGWSLSESYEAKLTVPERLTVKVSAASSQAVDASTKAFALGFELGVNAVISF